MGRFHAFGSIMGIFLCILFTGCSSDETTTDISAAAGNDAIDAGALEAADVEEGSGASSPGDLIEKTRVGNSSEEEGVDPEEDLSGSGDGNGSDDEEEEEAEEASAPGCTKEQCDIGGVCYDNQTPHPEIACRRCIVLVSDTEWSNASDLECDDENSCTQEDFCSNGTCVGIPVECPDDGPCQIANCSPKSGECEPEAVEGPCDDGDLCTLADACDDGSCVGGTSLPCDDGNPCTTDSCQEGECLLEMNTEPCDDGDDCSLSDTCNEGQCLGSATPCDDENACTLDTCLEGEGCVHKDLSAACADDDVCTDAACDPELGCVFPFNTAACDDGSACTVDDACLEGECVGPPLLVDDGNPCTDDSCDPEIGAVFTTNVSLCDDGDECTLGDVCADGGCLAGAEPKDCDDGELCTDDSCDAEEGCVYGNNSLVCDDGTVCTLDDQCDGGSCVGEELVCDDEEPCTADSCDAVEGCQFTLIVSNECRPTLVVDTPARGATIQGALGGTVTVSGTAIPGGSELVSFTINGEEVEVDEAGAFTYEMLADKGGNTIVVEALDSLGGERKVVQAFLYGAEYAEPSGFKTDMIEQGAANWTSAEAFDDFEPIMAAVFGDFDFTNGLIGVTVFEDLSHTWSIQSTTFDTPSVDITLFDGGMNIVSVTKNTTNKLKADCKEICVPGPFFVPICSCPPPFFDYTADFNIATITIDVDVFMSLSEDKELIVEVGDVSTDVSGTSVNVNVPFSFFFDSFLSFFTSFFVGTIEAQFTETIKSVMGVALKASFESFTQDLQFPFPSFNPGSPPVVITTANEFYEFDVKEEGMRIITSMGSYTSLSPTPQALSPEHLGYPVGLCAEGDEPDIPIPAAGDLEIVMADDGMNSLMYAAWRAGTMNFEVTPETFAASGEGGLDFGGLGVEDLDMQVVGLLPPVLSDCASGGGEVTLHVGDMMIDASMKLFGTPMDVMMYVSFEAGFDLGIGDSLISFGLTDIKYLEVQTDIAQPELVSQEALLTALVAEAIVPSFLSGFGGEGTGFPIPEIDLGNGATFGFNASTITRLPRHTFISGGIQ